MSIRHLLAAAVVAPLGGTELAAPTAPRTSWPSRPPPLLSP